MTGTYKRFDQIDADFFRRLILGEDEAPAAPAQNNTGLMAPATPTIQRQPSSTLTQEPRRIDATPALEESILSTVAQNMARNTDNRQQLADAVVPQAPRMDQPVDLEEWSSLPPLEQVIGGDTTRAALGSAPDPVNLEGSTRGATPVSQQQEMPTEETSTEWNATTFTRDILGRFEGTEAHASVEGGRDTAAYGVKYSLGLNRDDYDSDLDFAAAVAQKHYDSTASRFSSAGRNLSDLPTSVQNAVVDLHYNVGSIGSTAEKETPVDMMRNTLDFIGATTSDGTRGSVLSLARRRAENWNSAASDLGVSRISSIEQIPTNNGTEFRYLDADGNVVHRTTTSRTPITFTGGTSYRVNTQTRRVEIE